MKSTITIWDIDKTLYDGYVIIDFGKYLEKVGRFEAGFSRDIDLLLTRYKAGEISYEDFAKGVYKVYGEYINDKNQYEILQLNKQFWLEATTKLYPASQALYEFLTKLGSDHAAISGSSFESLYYLLDKLNFSKLKATEYETIDGNYTGKLVSTLVSHYDKSKLADRVLNQKNKYRKVLGVGDNHADVAFLQHVDIPIIVGVRDQDLIEWGRNHKAITIEDPDAKPDKMLLHLEELIST